MRFLVDMGLAVGVAGPALRQGAIVLVEETRYRVRRLPIGSAP